MKDGNTCHKRVTYRGSIVFQIGNDRIYAARIVNHMEPVLRKQGKISRPMTQAVASDADGVEMDILNCATCWV